MSQITWRNVNSDMSAYNGRALEGAGRSIDSMFEKLNGVVARTQAIDDKNWDTGKVNRTNDALNQIMGIATPEELAQKQKSGFLQQLVAGGQINEQEVRNALDARVPELQRRGKQTIDYNNTVVDQATNPLLEAAKAAAINKDFAGAQALLAEYSAKGGRFASQGAETIDSRERLVTTRGYEDKDQDMQERGFADGLLSSALSRDQMRNNMANDNARTGLDRERFNLSKAQAEYAANPNSRGNLEKQFAERIKAGPLSQGFYGTAEGAANLNKGLIDLGFNPDQKADLFANLSKYYKSGVVVAQGKDGKPIRGPLPISTILEAAASVGEGNPFSPLTPGWSRRGDKTVNEIDKRFGIYSSGKVNPSTAPERDLDLINEIGWYANAQNERTKGLNRPGADLEIKNPAPKGKGKKPTRR